VGDGGVEPDRDADLGELPAEPLAVRVEVLAAGQFAADRQDFCFHGLEMGLIRAAAAAIAPGTMKTSYSLAAAAVFAAVVGAVYTGLPAAATPPPSVPTVPPAPPSRARAVVDYTVLPPVVLDPDATAPVAEPETTPVAPPPRPVAVSAAPRAAEPP